MDEKLVTIINKELLIEGLLVKSSGDRGVVICHPHPLMGGSMHNNVVEAISDAFAAEKYSTLRFNFRGVGRSTGVHDGGRGEQEDLLAASNYMFNEGILQLSFAGYSFGSWVGSNIMEKENCPFKSCIFVSPPIDYFNFNFAKLGNKINLIICGNEDDICDLALLKEKIRDSDVRLKIVSGADHFYLGKEQELINILRKNIINVEI
jgi:uncharacterized protein